MKVCNKCKIEKALSEFSKDQSHKDGLQYTCKKCQSVYGSIYNKEHRAAKRTAVQRSREKYPEKHLARLKSRYLVKMPKGFVKHHWNYDPNYVKDIFILPQKMHGYIHRHLVPDSNKYRVLSTGELLLTRKMHRDFIIQILKK